MGSQLVYEVLNSYNGSPGKKLWLLAFAQNASDASRAGWPSQEEIARQALLSRQQETRVVSELVAEGVIERFGEETLGAVRGLRLQPFDQPSAQSGPGPR